MLTSVRSWSTVALTVFVGFTAPAHAQITADVGPLVGYYRPFGHFDPASVYSTSLPRDPSDLRGAAWGAEAHLSFGRRLGLEAQLAVANSTLPSVITPAGPTRPTSARVTVATLQGQFDVSPAPERLRLWVSAGPGLVQHGGDAYRSYGSPISVAAALGIGVAVPITSALHVTAGATALRYAFDLKMPPALQRNPGSLQHGAQTDAVIRLGVRWGHL